MKLLQYFYNKEYLSKCDVKVSARQGCCSERGSDPSICITDVCKLNICFVHAVPIGDKTRKPKLLKPQPRKIVLVSTTHRSTSGVTASHKDTTSVYFNHCSYCCCQIDFSPLLITCVQHLYAKCFYHMHWGFFALTLL